MIVTNSQIKNPDGSITEMVFIDDENGHGCSMTKSHYDEQQAANDPGN
jgi:hypothetical protein